MKDSDWSADMQTPAHIRRAGAADLRRLLPLCAEHAAYERLAYSTDGGEDELARALRTGRLHAWIAMDASTAIGYASATLDFSTLDRATFLHMDCLYVREAWRGRGVGHQLWKAVHAFARAQGCRTMQWQTPEWNADAARFYRRLGAAETIKRRYMLPLE
jgi:GNAT superfamily N-acetyltransferase